MTTVADLAENTAQWAIDAADSFVRRFCPEDRLPKFLGGYVNYPRTDSLLMRLYGMLARLGVKEIAGRSLTDRLQAMLGQVNEGRRYETWWALFLAEAIASSGPTWQDHPLLAGFDQAQRDELELATDSSHLVDLENGRLIGKPNNYWMVIARLERVRRSLGLPTNPKVESLAMARTVEVLCHARGDYLDDDEQGRGRYDVYTFHALDTSAPLWPDLPQDRLREIIAAHEKLIFAAARTDGGTIAWGRSAEIGAVWAMDLAATILAQGYGHERARLLGFVEGALQQFQTEGWADDAVTAHRGTMSHWYRGTSRLLEFSLDALGTVINVAAHLRHVAEQESALVSAPAAPASQDTWISFDNRGPGAWFYRNGSLDFQLPLINGYLSDYVAAPLSVGWLEQPVDSPMACGVPNLLYGKKRYIPLRRPESVHYEPGKLSWVNTCFTTYETKFDWWRPCEDIGGTRTVTIRVEDDTIVGEEHWTFEQIPDGLGIWFAESKTPLNVTWECDAPHHATTVAVSGMQEWRSFWNPLRMVHQLDIVPQQDVTVRYRLKPGPSS